mmetsp:Transcript_23947/g.47869  ORF Transcript_23947/g.47869 Transcript_23947/m.47869 type:complete len:859 (-) Transcript_23947:898-3474(-)
MGCGGSSPAGGGGDDDDVETMSAAEKAQKVASEQLQQELEAQNAAENAIIKLLVLGTGESGKSTVFKQMKILYSVPDPPSKFVMICRANLIGNAHTVLDGMEKLSISLKSDKAKEAAAVIRKCPTDGNVENMPSLVPHLKELFEDGGVKEAIERANEFQLNDSTIYFWERAEALCATDYLPNEQDVLRARVRTTGIVQQNFQIGTKSYTMFDVGGQRNERRKWIHCFDNVTAVIFVTAISEYDQVLYEDENTNRMDEALTLFGQICNHPSFKKTSMILFLNKRDLFEIKLKKKDLTCWRPTLTNLGNDYDKCIKYLKDEFLAKNENQLIRQVYVHATCATDTNNIAFVMESVFDIILKDNLRKLAKVDLSKIVSSGGGTGISTVDEVNVWDATAKGGRIVLAACWFTESLSERKVMVDAKDSAQLPGVFMKEGLTIETADWSWVMGLGKDLPDMPVLASEKGSFRGSFKEAAKALVAKLGTNDLGSVYDNPVIMVSGAGTTTIVIPVIKKLKTAPTVPGVSWVEHEVFENACYKKFANVDTDANPCAAPNKNEEFNPFAANPVGARWFKGVTLFTKEVLKSPDKGVYLGIFKVASTSEGFKIMVNEHNRISIPMIFLTETQLAENDKVWMHGVRIRQDQYNIDLLEGKQPNRGWLGPEMSGEEGATFPEKLWWAIDEAKARLDTDNIGFQYDAELLFIDENDSIQLLVFGQLAKNEEDLLAGHIWVDRETLEVQSMKYNCPVVLQGMIQEIQGLVNKYQALNEGLDQGMTSDKMVKDRQEKDKVKVELELTLEAQTPLKWVNRLIMWCADGMPSFGKSIQAKDANEAVKLALASNSELEATAERRKGVMKKYKNITAA